MKRHILVTRCLLEGIVTPHEDQQHQRIGYNGTSNKNKGERLKCTQPGFLKETEKM
jgi:hypothetical protein